MLTVDLLIGNAFLDQILEVGCGFNVVLKTLTHFNLVNKQLLVLSPPAYLTGSVGIQMYMPKFSWAEPISLNSKLIKSLNYTRDIAEQPNVTSSNG